MVSIVNTNLEANILEHFYPADDYQTLLKKFFKLFFIVHRRNPRSRFYLKSDARIKQEVVRQLKEAPYVISPFSIYRLLWERIMLFTWIVLFFLIPIFTIILYDVRIYVMNVLFWIDALLNIACFIDVIQNFFTGFYDPNTNVIVIEQKVIILEYMKFYFWVDVISSIPYNYFIWTLAICPGNTICSTDFIPMLRNLKLLRIRTLFLTFDQFRLNLNHFACKCLRILLLILFSLHWLTAVSYVIKMITTPTCYTKDFRCSEREQFLSSRIDENAVTNVTRGIQYVKLLHRTIFIMTLFSHDTPEYISLEDIVYTIVLTFLGLYIRIYLIAQFLLYISTFQRSMKMHQLRATLQRYMKFRQIPYTIQRRFIEYYDYRLQQRSFRENKILNNISTYLKEEIIMQSCLHLVKNLPIFQHLPEYLLPSLFNCLTTEIFLKNDYIIRAGQTGNTMYFIVNGTVAVYTPSGREVAHLKDGDHFGEIGLFSETNLRIVSIVAVETCDLLTLTRSDFLKCLTPFPELLDELREVSRRRIKIIVDEH